MKKLLGIVLSAAMLLSMAACCIQRCIQCSSRFYR